MDSSVEMRVKKRDGQLASVAFDKILNRIRKLGQEAGIQINYQSLAMKVIDQLYDTISTTKIDELAAEQCAALSTNHPDYGTLASRIVISNHQKNTNFSFSNTMKKLYDFTNEKGIHKPLISVKTWNFINKYSNELNMMIDYNRDYLIDYFGFKTLERAYLFRINNVVVERPQHMWMRVAVGIHGSMKDDDNDEECLKLIKESYDLMSQKYFTHATPTLFNAGTPRPQLSSCYLIAMEEDSIDGIYNTLKDCAHISKWAGGIGLHIHNVRAKGSFIQGTNGTSNGIVPMLRVFNNTARYVDQGGNKRNGSFAIYMEPWHADIEDFLEMRKNHGDEEMKARDLFYALWIPDLFMERVKNNGKWSLLCPNECVGLDDVYGADFEELYTNYESNGKVRKVVNARDLWFKILDAQMETGTPYLLYKDAANKKSNQKNLGTVKSSNLCVAPETLILTDKGHIEIQSVVNQTVNVWNGEEWSSVTIKKTGVDQELIDVYTDDGTKLTCTPYHNFYIQNNYSSNSIQKVEARELKPQDKIIKCDYPIIDGCDKMPYAYTHGFFCGDGTYTNKTDEPERSCQFKALPNHYFCKRHLPYETETYLFEKEYLLEGEEIDCQAKSYSKKPMVYLYGDKQNLLEYIEKRSYKIDEKSKRINVLLPVDLNEKFDTPSHLCTIKDKLDWFAGYCDADGCISKNGENEQLQISSINKEFLENVKLLLQTCGINPKIKLGQVRTESYLPDGKGGYKFFEVKPIYRLLITSCDLYKLYNLGFKPKRLIISGNKPSRDAKQFIKILKVENNNRIDDTYCFTEPKRNMGIFNGIITGQCTEIIEYSNDKETAVCNLASIGLPSFVNEETKQFDYDKLHEVTKVVTNNLNKVIDINFYPTEKTRLSNMKHRPIGIGVQGLADVFIMMDIPFHSNEAKEVNKLIFETIYHASLEKSNEIAIARFNQITENGKYNQLKNIVSTTFNHKELDRLNVYGQKDLLYCEYANLSYQVCGAYSSFVGSPASKGILQFDMWDVTPSDRYDWSSLRQTIVDYGLRNSLLIAPMPTASTSQILGFNECFEPFTSNLYSRRTLAGEFVIVNKYLVKELISLGLWNEQIKNNIIANQGSIQHLTMLPEHIRNKYKIVWEIPMKHVIDMAGDRGAYICQSQSMNLWVEDPTYNTLTSMHFYSWKKGLKTGIYYLRRKAKHQAQQFTIEPDQKEKDNIVEEKDEICEMCSA
jgi:ribonucleoside-diphosphate reductase alpha chain